MGNNYTAHATTTAKEEAGLLCSTRSTGKALRMSRTVLEGRPHGSRGYRGMHPAICLCTWKLYVLGLMTDDLFKATCHTPDRYPDTLQKISCSFLVAPIAFPAIYGERPPSCPAMTAHTPIC